MAATFTKIATVTVGSGGASSIDFTSIPSTYTDLCVKISPRSTATGNNWQQIFTQFNGDTASNYVTRLLAASGLYGVESANASTTSIRFIYSVFADATASTFANVDIYIPNYNSSNYKSLSSDSVTENNASDAMRALTAGIWNSTSAITSIKFTLVSSSNFAQYSTATLYGIKNA